MNPTPKHTEPTNPKAYAKRALYRLMQGGAWYSSRQISIFAKVSHANSLIRDMKANGYKFAERWAHNSHGIRYKEWRLMLPDTDPDRSPDTPTDTTKGGEQ